MAEVLLGSREEDRTRVADRRLEELGTAYDMVRVLEEIPEALEYCLRSKKGVAEDLSTECPNKYDDWGVARMAHWPIIGPIVEVKVGLLKRFLDGGPRRRSLRFWLREDGEIVVSWRVTDHSRVRWLALITELYNFKTLNSDQLAALLRGIQSI